MKFILIVLLAVSASAFKLLKSDTEGNSQVFGGIKATRGEFPYIIEVRKDGEIHCAGVIYNERWIISSAHCYPFQSFDSISVVAGQLNLENISGDEQVRPINRFFKHPEFIEEYLLNDIALIKLDIPFVFNDVVKSIPLQMETIQSGNGTVAGWGTTNMVDYPNDLYRVDVPIISDNTCYLAMGNMATESNICAGPRDGGRGSCYGDAGGPLVLKGDNSNTLAGIVSFGPDYCGTADLYGVYAEVAYYVEWIETTVKNNS